MERMYERAMPVSAGDIVNRVFRVSKDTNRISRIPRNSSRKPSHLYFKV
jgi:hypothetical protein